MRRVKWMLLAVLVVAAAGALRYGPRIYRLGTIGAGYVAKQMCSCVFVAGRSAESCRSDMPPDMASVRAEILDGGSGVRAWVPLIVERTAHHAARSGCTLY
jgi:hypothetical protein